VVSLTKEKEKLAAAAEVERQSHQKALEGLQVQNRDLIEEVTALRLKLGQAHGLLRSYQLKVRPLGPLGGNQLLL
jgi:phage shock protein A